MLPPVGRAHLEHRVTVVDGVEPVADGQGGLAVLLVEVDDDDLGESGAGAVRPAQSVEEKIAITRTYREDRYAKLCDAVYKRRGWTTDGVPTMETITKLGIAFPEVVELVKKQ